MHCITTWHSITFYFWYCRALVEVKPILYVPETSETTEETLNDLSGVMTPSYFGFQPADWHDSCIQKFVIHGKICAVVLSITGAVALKICSDSMNADWSNGNHRNYLTEGQMKRISRFCIYVLDKFIMENGFSWKDTMVSFLSKCLVINIDSI